MGLSSQLLNSRERRGYDRMIELNIDDLAIITTIRKVECTGRKSN